MRLLFSLVFSIAMCSACTTNAGSDVWPSTIVKMEDLHVRSALELKVPPTVKVGQVTGPSVLRAHVASDGTVARTVLVASCGNSDLDEAAMRALSDMRFEPYLVGSTPTDVTLYVPVHVPRRLGRKHE